MAPKHSLTEDEDAFLEYVRDLRNSVGKRFITHHIETYGFESFEAFWEKLRDAGDSNTAQMELSKDEAESLAHALHASSRREFILGATGLGLALVAAVTGKVAADGLNEMAQSKRAVPFDKALATTINLSASVLSGIFSVSFLLKPTEPSKARIATIAKGAEGERNVAQLVSSLNAVFKTVDVAMDETYPRGM